MSTWYSNFPSCGVLQFSPYMVTRTLSGRLGSMYFPRFRKGNSVGRKHSVLPADKAVFLPREHAVEVYLYALHHDNGSKGFPPGCFQGSALSSRAQRLKSPWFRQKCPRRRRRRSSGRLERTPEGSRSQVRADDGARGRPPKCPTRAQVGRTCGAAPHSLLLRKNTSSQKKTPTLSAFDEKRDYENKHCCQPNQVKPVRVRKKLLIWGLWRRVDTMLSFKNGKACTSLLLETTRRTTVPSRPRTRPARPGGT